MVQMTIDLEVPPHPRAVLMFLGKYDILEVSVSLLDLSTLSLLFGLLEEMSWMSDPLMGLAHAALLALTPESTPPSLSLPSPRISAESLIARPSAPPAIAMQLPIPTTNPPIPPLRASLPKTIAVPTAQASSFFASMLLTTPF